MNRSTGLLRAYVSLLRRVSGAVTVSLYAPPAGETSAIYLVDGELPLPEHRDLDRARRFAAVNEERGLRESRPPRIESVESPGWLTAVCCAPFARPSQGEERRRPRPRDARVELRPEAALDGRRLTWIGMRFDAGEGAPARSVEAFRLLAGAEGAGEGGELASLLSLGGVLSWYAGQISSILDDPVTGLAGRAEFQASLSRAFDHTRESGGPLTLLFINPDDFTTVNEKFGHEAGDRVLREIATRLRASHRGSDVVAKYGGAIFASFLPDTDRASGRVVADKAWEGLAGFPFLDDRVRLGISVGVATLEPGEPGVEECLELIRRADKALNAAKRYGGNRVVPWEPELESRDLGSHDRMTGVFTGNMAKDYRNMTLLSETMTVVAGTNDLEELMEQVVERLYATLKLDHAGIVDWEEGELCLLEGVTRSTAADGASEAARSLEFTEAKLDLLERSRREAKGLTATFADDFTDQRILAFAVPLLLNDRSLGCLYLDGRVDAVALEGSSDLVFLRALATQLAVALDRARLSGRERRQQERERMRLRAELDDLRSAADETRLVHRSPEMEAVLMTARRVAPTKATVLLIGESGTGKELVARKIHELSPFRSKPLVVVDCGAIPTTLIESELFGHERGAYTGAQDRRIGRLLEAEGGTVVLDEIGELPLEAQSKLLRFVQERQIVPVGGTGVRYVDTRLIAVTHRELAVEVAAGRFREDLFYRLNVVRVTVPPLRERPEDIFYLAEHFLERFSKQYQKTAIRFSESARKSLLEHSWPGNVRELSNRILQAVILAEGPEIGLRELDLDVALVKRTEAERRPEAEVRSSNGDRNEAWEALRLALRRQITEAVTDSARAPLPLGTWLMEDLVLEAYQAGGGVSGRARTLLGIPETTFRRRLQKVTAHERAGLLTRRPPWSEVRPRIAALVRSSPVAREDLLDAARTLLLEEVASSVDDPARGAALMGVTLRTYRRWMSELRNDLSRRSETSMASGL